MTDTTDPSRQGIDADARAVTAFFDSRDAADRARSDLVAAGVPDSAITVVGNAAPSAEDDPHPGLWQTVKEFFMPYEDRHLYAEGVRRGGFALAVDTDSAAYAHVIDILDRDGAVDLEERSAGWREEGWTGAPDSSAWAAEERAFAPPSAGTAGFGASMADQPLVGAPSLTGEIEPGLVTDIVEDRMRAGAAAPDSIYAAGAPGLGDTTRESTPRPGETQPEPSIVRDTSHGRTRVRSYLLDDPKGDGSPPV